MSNVRLKTEQKRKKLIYMGLNIEPFKQEVHSGDINNYRGRLLFEEAYERRRVKLKQWQQVADFYNDNIFGFKQLLLSDFYFRNDLREYLEDIEPATDIQLSKKIFEYVQDNLTWDGTYSTVVPDLESIYRSKTGSVGGINLILLAMLRHEGIRANPLLAASRSNGYILFPTIDGFDNTLVHVQINGQEYILDASRKFNGFGQVPLAFVNGDALVVYENYKPELISTRTNIKSKDIVSIECKLNPEEQSVFGVTKNLSLIHI